LYAHPFAGLPPAARWFSLLRLRYRFGYAALTGADEPTQRAAGAIAPQLCATAQLRLR